MTADGEFFIAGALAELPALAAVGSPSVAGYLRSQPSDWAEAYACWGHENREAILRLITGIAGSQPTAPSAKSSASTKAATPT
jgi:glutamine synthetase